MPGTPVGDNIRLKSAAIEGQPRRDPIIHLLRPLRDIDLKVKDGDNSQWWKVLAFPESARTELMRLTDGDTLSVQGALKAETYEKDGTTKLSLSVIADHVLALRQPRKRAKQETSFG